MIKSKGITLVSLVIYIIIMLMVIGVIGSISLMFHNNTENLDKETKALIQFNNFNNYFVKEIKSVNNNIDQIGADGTYILFKTGNAFSFKNNNIYYNDILIAEDVKNINFQYEKNSENIEIKNIIVVNIEFENYSKQMKYKIENIY